MKKKSPDCCPVCGTPVPAGARACPDCGADERTGWDEEKTRYDGLDLPDKAFDYEETLRDNDLKPRHVRKGVSPFWWLVGVVLIVVAGALALYS